MLILFRIYSSSDWKGRPNVQMTKVGQVRQSCHRGVLLQLQNEDIKEWQKDDIASDIEMEKEDAEAEERKLIPHNGEWKTDFRWEMDEVSRSPSKSVEENEGLRQFAGFIGEEPWSYTYVIAEVQDLPMV